MQASTGPTEPAEQAPAESTVPDPAAPTTEKPLPGALQTPHAAAEPAEQAPSESTAPDPVAQTTETPLPDDTRTTPAAEEPEQAPSETTVLDPAAPTTETFIQSRAQTTPAPAEPEQEAPRDSAPAGLAASAEVSAGDEDGSESDGLDPRAGFETVPLEEVVEGSATPALGTEAVADGWGGPDLVESVYGTLTEFYERIDARLREVQEDVPPMGWRPHIAALRALREERVAGDWEVLSRFLVAPGALEKSDDLRLVRREDGDEVVRDFVRELAAADGRALLVAPTPERAAELLRGLEADPEVFSLLIETRPATAEADSVETQAFPPVPDEVAPTPESARDSVRESVRESAREPGSNGTVEFRPVSETPQESPSAVTRVEALPVLPLAEPAAPDEGPSAPEARVRSAALRPVGEAWRQAWETEIRLLRRGLMALEQWPRDAAALQSVEAEHRRRGEELEAERAAMARAIEEYRKTVSAAGQAAEEAEAEAERLAGVQREAEEELVGPRAEAERLRTEAEEAATEANALTRSADASYARCLQMDERAKTAQSELQAARETEASLTDELARAKEALPHAEEEYQRLASADADAAAEGHAAYYRLAASESALAGVRRRMTLGQRLHVASPPAELKSLRAEVRSRTREADEAATRAREAKDAAENAERIRRGLASFVEEGGARLVAAQEAQERLGTELAWLATEREKVGAEHQEQARLAAESVERATQAAMRARSAQQAAQVIEDRVNSARTSRERALAAAGRARSDAEKAEARAAETEAALERRTAEAATEMSARDTDLAAARRTEELSREKVRETCGADPAEDPEVVPEHQRRAMARIEQLSGHLHGERAAGGDVLLGAADVVVGTPAGIGLTARDEEFDALIVADAGEVTDGEFLIGAVRARRWLLVGTPDSRPPSYREYANAPAGRLDTSPFERACTAAPHLVEDG